MSGASEEITIVLAEDDDGHAVLIQRNLVRAGVQSKILRAKDGIEALNFLEVLTSPDRSQAEKIVVLLDIRMPLMDGIEILRRIKTEERTSIIPVYMLTTSDDPREVDRCFRLGCNAYLVKSVAHAGMREVIEKLVEFLRISMVPKA